MAERLVTASLNPPSSTAGRGERAGGSGRPEAPLPLVLAPANDPADSEAGPPPPPAPTPPGPHVAAAGTRVGGLRVCAPHPRLAPADSARSYAGLASPAPKQERPPVAALSGRALRLQVACQGHEDFNGKAGRVCEGGRKFGKRTGAWNPSPGQENLAVSARA